MAADAPSLAIVICTFRRPDLLRRALRSVAAQDAPASPHGAVNVYVIDNSDEGDARAGRRGGGEREPLADRLARGPSGEYFGGAQRRSQRRRRGFRRLCR